ncbi:uncharacterized protein [Nicotiana sylvestris]|uniref:uncharacterized protein n=1 Tax=Nicotiana sylvestris TaxID=4096 RepID=UPI00388C5F07
MKAQALPDHLAKNPVNDEYQPLSTYFSDEEVNSVEVIPEGTNAWKMFFDGAMNAKGAGIGAILISPTGQHYLTTTRLWFFCTNNTAEYEACIMGMNMAVDQDVEEFFVRKCHQCQVYGDLIHAPPLELHPMSASWSFVVWGMDVIGPIEPKASNVNRFILVVIDYFIKWVKTVTFKVVTKKVVVDFVHSNIICHFCIPKTIITDNAANLNSHLIREVCEQFQMTHRNSTLYRPKANGVIEAANKNIKKILRKMIQGSRQWHKKFPFALLGYHTIVRTSIGETPYLLVYGTETVIPTEVEIPSLRIIVEAEIEDSEWVKTRLEQLSLIDEKQMTVVCHGQLYQQRMARAYNKKVRPRNFEVGKLVLRRILPHHSEAKGKFAPNWKGPYIIRKLLPRWALYLGDIEGNDPETAVNADAVKRYYV